MAADTPLPLGGGPCDLLLSSLNTNDDELLQKTNNVQLWSNVVHIWKLSCRVFGKWKTVREGDDWLRHRDGLDLHQRVLHRRWVPGGVHVLERAVHPCQLVRPCTHRIRASWSVVVGTAGIRTVAVVCVVVVVGTVGTVVLDVHCRCSPTLVTAQRPLRPNLP